MEDFNVYSTLFAFVSGVLSYVFGGWTALLVMLIVLTCIDFVTGGIKSVYNKKLSSAVCWQGIIKKVMMFAVVAVANITQNALNDSIPLRDIVISFYAYNEALSILENAAEFVKIPDKLREVLAQLNKED